MRKYELLFILPGTLDENEAQIRSNEILDLVKETSEKAEINSMGKNRLAYPIKGIRYGYFYTVVFEVEPENLQEIQKKLALTRDLLRSVITHFNVNPNENSGVAYATDEMGITTIKKTEEEAKEEKTEEKEEKKEEENKKEVDLADIDDKLDKILEGDIVPGV